ncbi:hypothetical protein HY68_11460 [Streptomyces sp. AcH 505]|uniref:hypothetical protein n=1 Tax=unclassified Streptomyces TaxID=2593676 RepID=UPI000592373E|nr:hypothetical protein [Streptomyces sp. NBC_00370]KIF69069.1 hypothetical protein HY68_11460 [Streptomyces sp. AcH 505]
MAKQPVEIITQASMQEIAELFRRSMRVSWINENITGAGTRFEEPTGSVFDHVDQDRPDFAVVALLGGRGAGVHMYVWDRGEQREIAVQVVRTLEALGIKANGKVRRFIAALEEGDPSLKYSGI